MVVVLVVVPVRLVRAEIDVTNSPRSPDRGRHVAGLLSQKRIHRRVHRPLVPSRRGLNSMNIARSRWAAIGAAIAVSAGAGGLGLVHASSAVGSVMTPIAPCRLLDTRTPGHIGLPEHVVRPSRQGELPERLRHVERVGCRRRRELLRHGLCAVRHRADADVRLVTLASQR